MAEDENKSPLKDDETKPEAQEKKPGATESPKKGAQDSKDEGKAEEQPKEDMNDVEEEENDVKEEEDDDEEEDEEEEELPPGLLEQPLEIEGKREKKKVERLSASMARAPTEKKKVVIEEGSGVKLGDIAYVAGKVNVTKAADMKPLYRLLFLRVGTLTEIKKNIRQFNGFTQGKDSKEYEKRVAILNKMVLADLKFICMILGVERGGTKVEVVERLMDFLKKPADKGLTLPTKAKRKSSDKTPDTKKGKKRKRPAKKEKKDTKKKKDSKKKKKNTPTVEDSAEEDEEEMESENENSEDEGEEDDYSKSPEVKKAKKRERPAKKEKESKKKKSKAADSDSEDAEESEDEKSEEEEEEEESEEEEVAPPPKKKKKIQPKTTTPKAKKTKAPKENGKKEKKPAKKETKNSSPKKNKVQVPLSDISDSGSDDSDDEPIAKMKAQPPSNDEIKGLVKKILEGADLETVTMKTVVKQVYSEYPTFDLSDRKDFIKQTVREVIS